jgi:hypothetical protein
MPGKIVYANMAGQPLILVSDVEVASEMLHKKGTTCSDRPVWNMAGELGGNRQWTVFLMYGPRLKESRKYIHRAIGTPESLEKYEDLFNSEAQKFLKATLRDPDNIQQHIRLYLTDSLYISEIKIFSTTQLRRLNNRPYQVWLRSARARGPRHRSRRIYRCSFHEIYSARSIFGRFDFIL